MAVAAADVVAQCVMMGKYARECVEHLTTSGFLKERAKAPGLVLVAAGTDPGRMNGATAGSELAGLAQQHNQMGTVALQQLLGHAEMLKVLMTGKGKDAAGGVEENGK